MRTERIVISRVDHSRLRLLLNGPLAFTAEPSLRRSLQAELLRAEIVDAEDVTPDIVTMDSSVLLRDLDDDSLEMYTLVYPNRADTANGRLSILSPIGTAILGYRIGDEIEWHTPEGLRRFRIEGLTLVPEREEQLLF